MARMDTPIRTHTRTHISRPTATPTQTHTFPPTSCLTPLRNLLRAQLRRRRSSIIHPLLRPTMVSPLLVPQPSDRTLYMNHRRTSPVIIGTSRRACTQVTVALTRVPRRVG
jgi:hypothetical protein